MPAGRPTKYTPELLEAAYDYVNGGWKGKDDEFVIPSRIGLAMYLGVSDTTIDNWEKDEDKPEFIGILTHIKHKQHETLINSGLKGEFNSHITKLVLGKHGYSEKTDNTHSGPDGQPLGIPIQFVEPDDGRG